MANRERLIEKPLRYLKQVCLEDKKIPIGGNAPVQSAVDRLSRGSPEHGLLPEEIDKLVKIICSRVLRDNKCKMLIKCLLPSSYVPVNAILRCFSWMNTNKATNTIKAMLLCWIVSVLELVDDLGPVLLLYDAVCFWMNSDALRHHASVLLTLITRKEDVRLYRVQRFLRLKSALGTDAHLNRVLSLYKDYCPHLIPTTIRYSSKGISPRPYLFWMNHVKAIQARNAEMERPMFNTYHNSRVFWATQNGVSPKKAVVGKKRKLTAVFPEIRDLTGPLSYSSQNIGGGDDLVPLNSISSMDKLLENIARLELPNQALLVLKYPVLRNLISCYKDSEYLMRFKYRVHWILFDDLICGALREKEDTELFLLKLMQFCEYLQEGHPVVEQFLERYLAFFWNGHDYSELILSFLTRLRLRSVEYLKRILDPIRRVFNSSLLLFKFDVLTALTKLLSNMMHVEYKRYLKIQDIATTSATPAIDKTNSNFMYLFDDETLDYDPVYTIVHLIDFMNELCIRCLTMENGNTLLLHSAISFYQLAVKLVSEYSFPYFICPPPVVVYSALFCCDGVAVSRMCGLLVNCTDAISEVKSMAKHREYYPDLVETSTAQIKLINNYAVDFINSLWKDRSFDPMANMKSSVFRLFATTVADIDIPKMNSAFSVSKHMGFVGHALTFAKTIWVNYENCFIKSFFKNANPDKYSVHSVVAKTIVKQIHVASSSTDFSFTPHKMSKTQKQSYLGYLRHEGYGNIELLIKKFLKLP